MSLKNISGSTEMTVVGGVRVAGTWSEDLQAVGIDICVGCSSSGCSSSGCSSSGCTGIKSPVLMFKERRVRFVTSETKVTAMKKTISLCLIVTNNKGLLCIWKEDFCDFNYRCSLSETRPRFNGKGLQSLCCVRKVAWLCWGLSWDLGS